MIYSVKLLAACLASVILTNSSPEEPNAPEEVKAPQVGDSLWLQELPDIYTVHGNYTKEKAHGHEVTFRIAYMDWEHAIRSGRYAVIDSLHAHTPNTMRLNKETPDSKIELPATKMRAVVKTTDSAMTTLHVLSDVANRQIHSVLHVKTSKLNIGDTLVMTGRQTAFYPNRKQKSLRVYDDEGKFVEETVYDTLGRIVTTQSYHGTTEYIEYYPSGLIRKRYALSPTKHKNIWVSLAEDGTLADSTYIDHLVAEDDGVYIEYDYTPCIPAGEAVGKKSKTETEYTHNEPAPSLYMQALRDNRRVIHPVWKAGMWNDPKEKYLVPRRYFVEHTRWLDYYNKDGKIVEAVYSCTVDREGRKRDIRVDVSSGKPEFDEKMLAAIREMPVYAPGGVVRRRWGTDEVTNTPHTYIITFILIQESMPEFPGGQEALFAYLSANVKYPKEAQMNGVEGRAICEFVVDKDGTLTDLKILRTSGDALLDAEALRVVGSMPRWKPAMQRGKPVRVKYTIPVNFKLQ